MTAPAMGLVLLGLALVCAGNSMWRQAGPPEASLFAAFAQEAASKPDGGNLVPLRQVSDPYSVFNGIAVDPANNIVAMTDVNRKSLLSYARNKQSAGAITAPRRQVFGPRTNIGFVAGVLLDPDRRELYAVNNDIEDTLVVMPYDAGGNAAPSRILSVPHQSWGSLLATRTIRSRLRLNCRMPS